MAYIDKYLSNLVEMHIIISFLQQLVLQYYLEEKSVENITLGNF